jgi:orotidine-5'-phosphate decarboxylase
VLSADLAVVRAAAGKEIKTVVPGVRFETGGDDQSRTGTPRETICAERIILSSDVRSSSRRNRVEMIKRIAGDIREGFECRKKM